MTYSNQKMNIHIIRFYISLSLNIIPFFYLTLYNYQYKVYICPNHALFCLLLQTKAKRGCYYYVHYRKYPPKWVDISDGDEIILQIVNSYGVVSAEQIYALLGGSMQYLNRRLRKLSLPMFDYLRRLEQRLGFGHYLYSLGKAGVKWLVQHNYSPKRRVFSSIWLYRSQVISCITVACRETGVELAWYPEDRIKDRIIRHFRNVKGQKLKLSFIPDVFLSELKL